MIEMEIRYLNGDIIRVIEHLDIDTGDMTKPIVGIIKYKTGSFGLEIEVQENPKIKAFSPLYVEEYVGELKYYERIGNIKEDGTEMYICNNKR